MPDRIEEFLFSLPDHKWKLFLFIAGSSSILLIVFYYVKKLISLPFDASIRRLEDEAAELERKMAEADMKKRDAENERDRK
ncbi:MAG: hypothetical protein M0025_07825 [Elusimicrobia bacterium]|nr:hypothetical protein [Elusimicrobiota bacterium]MDA8244011.1 hypothetical protein [Elusimicrobiota bacterium]